MICKTYSRIGVNKTLECPVALCMESLVITKNITLDMLETLKSHIK